MTTEEDKTTGEGKTLFVDAARDGQSSPTAEAEGKQPGPPAGDFPHVSDSELRIAAANLPRKRAAVLKWLADRGALGGTMDEAGLYFASARTWGESTARGRLVELVGAGLAVKGADDDTRATRTGHSAHIYRATVLGAAVARNVPVAIAQG